MSKKYSSILIVCCLCLYLLGYASYASADAADTLSESNKEQTSGHAIDIKRDLFMGDWGKWISGANISEKTLNSIFKLVLTANTFRLAAAKDVKESIEIAGIEEVKKKWQSIISEQFGEQKTIWNDFFNNSIIWIGRLEEDQGVVAFYNPWIDVIMISCWRGPVEDQKLLDFEFITGETWRGEELKEDARVPAWQREEAPVTVSLAKYYHASLKIFQSLYPLEGNFVFLSGNLKKSIRDREPDLLILHARASDRISMFAEYLQPKSQVAQKNNIRNIVNALRNAISNAEQTTILQLTSKQQKERIVNSIVQLPQEVRSTLYPTYFYHGVNRAVVVLVSPIFPKWFIASYFFELDAGKVHMDTIELCEIELAKILLEGVQTRREKD